MRESKNNRKPYQGKSYGNRVDILGDRIPKMYKTTCDNCGKTCEVPFRPSNGKPVYCNDCFASMGDGVASKTRRFDRKGYGRNEKEFFTAVCDECGKTCELPFKPSSNKPVYCSYCFEKKGNSNRSTRGNNNDSLLEQLEKMNQKLDKLIQALHVGEE